MMVPFTETEMNGSNKTDGEIMGSVLKKYIWSAYYHSNGYIRQAVGFKSQELS